MLKKKRKKINFDVFLYSKFLKRKSIHYMIKRKIHKFSVKYHFHSLLEVEIFQKI